MTGIEREYGDINLAQHLTHEGSRLKCPDPLVLQSRRELVDFEHQFAKAVVYANGARADGKIAFAHRCLHVGKRSQWTNYGRAYLCGKSKPGRHYKGGQRPARLGIEGVVPRHAMP